jgi:hypothetical protein
VVASSPLLLFDHSHRRYHSTKQQFLEWASQLTSVQLPSWIALPNMAERVLLSNRARDLVNKMNLLQSTGGDEKFETFAPGGSCPVTLA